MASQKTKKVLLMVLLSVVFPVFEEKALGSTQKEIEAERRGVVTGISWGNAFFIIASVLGIAVCVLLLLGYAFGILR